MGDAIRVEDLTIAYGDFVVQRDLSFSIGRGEVFIIMGGSGLRQELSFAGDDRAQTAGPG